MRQKRFTTFVSTQTGFNGPVATTLVASVAHRSGETTTKWRRSKVACTCANLFLFGCFGKKCTIHLDLVVSFELKILCCCIKGIVPQNIQLPKPHSLVSHGVFVPLGLEGCRIELWNRSLIQIRFFIQFLSHFYPIFRLLDLSIPQL